MTVVLVPWMTSSISMVIALLLLLVLLNCLNTKKNFNSKAVHEITYNQEIVQKPVKHDDTVLLVLTLSPLSSGSSSVKNSRFG